MLTCPHRDLNAVGLQCLAGIKLNRNLQRQWLPQAGQSLRPSQFKRLRAAPR